MYKNGNHLKKVIQIHLTWTTSFNKFLLELFFVSGSSKKNNLVLFTWQSAARKIHSPLHGETGFSVLISWLGSGLAPVGSAY